MQRAMDSKDRDYGDQISRLSANAVAAANAATASSAKTGQHLHGANGFGSLSVDAQAALADKISNIVADRLFETLSPQHQREPPPPAGTTNDKRTPEHDRGVESNPHILAQLHDTLRLFKSEIIDEIEEKLHLDKSVEELKTLMQRRSSSLSRDRSRDHSRGSSRRGHRSRHHSRRKQGRQDFSKSTPAYSSSTMTETVKRLKKGCIPLRATTLLSGAETPQFVGNDQRRDSLAGN